MGILVGIPRSIIVHGLDWSGIFLCIFLFRLADSRECFRSCCVERLSC